jgi:hypothetical protein
VRENPTILTDEGTMITWFASAIMAGYDAGERCERTRGLNERIREMVGQVAGASMSIAMHDHPEYIFPTEQVCKVVDRILIDFGIPLAPQEAQETLC